MNQLENLRRRLKRIGIDIDLVGNLPWIYLRSVNGNKISKEDWTDNHGYTIAFYNLEIEMPYLEKTFIIIRKYKC